MTAREDLAKVATDALLSVSITAGAIQSHYPPIDDRRSHQLRINSTSFIHFTPETAALWLPYLESIANEGINE